MISVRCVGGMLSVWGVALKKYNKTLSLMFFHLEEKKIGDFLKFSRQVERHTNFRDSNVERTALSYQVLQQKTPSLDSQLLMIVKVLSAFLRGDLCACIIY